jgi:hypothetical protein
MKSSRIAQVALVLLFAGAVFAASVDAGKITYANNCLVCHGTPPDQLSNPDVLIGTNSPANIRYAMANVPAMSFLSGLSDTDVANIAIYLYHPLTTDADRIFDWGQKTYPALLTPAAISQTAGAYYYRAYQNGVYVGTSNGHVYFLDAKTSANILDLGTVDSFLNLAQPAGF